MGNRFRQAVSLIMLLSLGGIIYLFARATGGTPGVAVLVLKQAVFLFGAIVLVLFIFKRIRPKA